LITGFIELKKVKPSKTEFSGHVKIENFHSCRTELANQRFALQKLKNFWEFRKHQKSKLTKNEAFENS